MSTIRTLQYKVINNAPAVRSADEGGSTHLQMSLSSHLGGVAFYQGKMTCFEGINPFTQGAHQATYSILNEDDSHLTVRVSEYYNSQYSQGDPGFAEKVFNVSELPEEGPKFTVVLAPDHFFPASQSMVEIMPGNWTHPDDLARVEAG